jgi:hypothetical protein
MRARRYQFSYCGYAISAACLGMAAVRAVRYLSRLQHAE